MRRFASLGLCVLLLVVAGYSQNVYFGNLHSHTAYSDGSGTPAEAYKHARDVAHIDFLAITEHNHDQAEQGAKDRADGLLIATDHNLYNGTGTSSLISAAAAANDNGHFVAIYGQEVSTISSGNHVNIFEIPNVIEVPNGAYNDLVQLLSTTHDSRGRQPIMQLNHPGLNKKNPAKDYGQDDFGSDAEWIKNIDKYARTIVVLTGPATAETTGNRPQNLEKYFLGYLSLGFHVAPAADQDNHYKTWGDSTDARTGVIANSLTKADILDAIDKRHVYATEDKDLRIIFKVNGHLMGDIVAPPAVGSALTVDYSIRDDDEPGAGFSVQPYVGHIGGAVAQPVDKFEIEAGQNSGTLPGLVFEGPKEYLFFKITKTNEDGEVDRAWTAPIWFDTTGATPPDVHVNTTSNPDGGETRGAADVSQFVASRRSAVYHFPTCKDAQRIAASNKLVGEDAVHGRTRHENCPR
jgi:hypothetical protein